MTLSRCCASALAFLLAIILICSLPLFGQSDTATISGTITDQTGAAVVGADVKLTNVLTGISSVTTSNETGLYVFPNVRPSQYRMIVEKSGFRQVVLTDLTVNVQDTLSRNFRLQVGVVGESVTVRGDVLNVNTESATVSTVVDQQFVDNMPLNGRSFQSLIYSTPGVIINTGADETNLGMFSVNGQRANANYFTIDGVSANVGSTWSVMLGDAAFGSTPMVTAQGGTNGMISVDAMQEFRIQTSNYAPEFGRQPGGQISIVSKSGGNQWHGSANDYIRNDYFDARNYWNIGGPHNASNPNWQPMPELRQNDFGGTFSGPIWKNHTFFFFSYEGLRLLQPTFGSMDALTPDMITQIPASSYWSQVLKGMPTASPSYSNYSPDNAGACGASSPDPNPADAAYVPCTASFIAAQSNPSHFDAISIKIDHNITKNLTAFGRWNRTPSYQGTYYLNEFDENVYNLNTMTAGITWTINPTMVNDLRGNWSRTLGHYTSVNNSSFGAVAQPDSVLYPSWSGLNSSNSQSYFATLYGEVRNGSRSANPIRQWNFVDNFSKSLGAHQLKFGADWRRMAPITTSMTDFAEFAWGTVDASGNPVSGYEELYTGQFDTLLSDNGARIWAHITNLSFYGQDTWKLNSRLTVNYGLRWDINTAPTSDTPGKPLYSVNGIFNNLPFGLTASHPLWNTQWDAIAPRLGFAYQVTPNTTLRAGAGMFYDLGYGGTVSGTMGSDFPYEASTFNSGLFTLDFNNTNLFQTPAFTTVPSAGSLGVDAVNPNLRLPVTYEWNIAVERQLGKSQSITASYVGNAGNKLLSSAWLEPLGTVYDTGNFNMSATTNLNTSHYNALQLQYKRHMASGLQAMVNYTYAHANDNNSSDQSGYFAQNASEIQIPPMERSSFDIRQNIQAMVSYQFPKTEFGGRIGQFITNGWALDGVERIQSGPPLDVVMGVYVNPETFFDVNPDYVSGVPVWVPDPTQPAGKRLNYQAFTAPASLTSTTSHIVWGTCARNSIQSPYGIVQTDMALRRRFNITERVKLDLRMEYFNLFNHPMFGGRQGSISTQPYTFLGWCMSLPCTGDAWKMTPSGGSDNYAFGAVWPGWTYNKAGSWGGGGQSDVYSPGGPRDGQLSVRLTF